MKNSFKILLSLIVLSGFILAALSCTSSKGSTSRDGSIYDNTNSSGKDNASLVPNQMPSSSILQEKEHAHPEVL